MSEQMQNPVVKDDTILGKLGINLDQMAEGSTVLTPEMVAKAESESKAAKQETVDPPKQEKKEAEQTPAPEKAKKEDKPEPISVLRKQRDEATAELSKLREQLAEFDGTRSELEKLRDQFAEAQKQVEAAKKIESVAALEMSDEFQNKYVKGREKLSGSLNDIVETAGIDSKDIFDALKNPNKKEKIDAINSIYVSLPEYLRDEFRSALKGLETLDSERAAELANAQDALQRRQQERESSRAKAESESRQRHSAAWEKAAAQAKEWGLDETDIKEAREFFERNRDEEKAALTVVQAKRLKRLEARLAEVEEENARYKESNPSLDAGGASIKSSDEGKSLMERLTGMTPSGIFSAR